MSFLTALRDTLESTAAPGPRLLLAGLIDGPGPKGFGITIAETAVEGRRSVDAYHARGFRQIKLYNSITAPVAGAVIRRAHELGMTVTGHVPVAMGLRAVLDSGMDHVAHLPFSGEETPAEIDERIRLLVTHHTVMDPTVAWNELLGRAPSTAVTTFEPGIAHTPVPLALNYGSIRNQVDSVTAASDRALGLRLFRAMFEAGVPIVAGTDGGIPGHSLFRELELSVAAGLTPLQAIQTATRVPARVMKLDQETGSIEAGKAADLLILDADPLVDISNIRTGRWVVRGGRMYECHQLWEFAGFRPS